MTGSWGRTGALLALAVVLATARALVAQTATPGPGGRPPAPVGRAVALAGRVNLDGRLDESVWATAPAIGDFVQVQPTTSNRLGV